MSDLWNHASATAAARITGLGAPREAKTFTPWSQAYGAPAADENGEDGAAHGGSPIDPTDLQASAFAEGFNQGRRTVEMEVAAERDAIARLAETLEQLEPEPPHELGAMLAETVERLVRQIVGVVAIDRDLLLDRAMNAAALIAEEATPSKMKVHPDDLARLDGANLPLELVGDVTLAPGTILVETGEGWIEDGPVAGLEKLRIALDKLGVPR